MYSDNRKLVLKVPLGYIRTLAFLCLKLGDSSGFCGGLMWSGPNFKDVCGYFQNTPKKRNFFKVII